MATLTGDNHQLTILDDKSDQEEYTQQPWNSLDNSFPVQGNALSVQEKARCLTIDHQYEGDWTTLQFIIRQMYTPSTNTFDPLRMKVIFSNKEEINFSPEELELEIDSSQEEILQALLDYLTQAE